MITRRLFLAGSLLSLPGAGLVARVAAWLPVREAEFFIGFGGDRMIQVVTYANGSIEAFVRGQAMRAKQQPDAYQYFEASGDGWACSAVVKRCGPSVIGVRSMRWVEPQCEMVQCLEAAGEGRWVSEHNEA